MQLKITGKNLDIGDALRAHVNERVEQVLDKLFDRGASGHVLMRKDGVTFTTECTIHLDTGVHLQANGSHTDPYASFEQAAEHLEKRLRRYKRRLKEHRAARTEDVAAYVLAPPADQSEDPEAADAGPDGDAPVIVAEATTPLPTLAVSEAVMRMDLAELPFVLFRNAGHGGLNVVYRRDDGNVGWIDPALDGAQAKSA